MPSKPDPTSHAGKLESQDINPFEPINTAVSDAFTKELQGKKILPEPHMVSATVQRYNMSSSTVPQWIYVMALSIPQFVVKDDAVRDKALSTIQDMVVKASEKKHVAQNLRNINVDKSASPEFTHCVKIFSMKMPDLLAGVNQSLSEANQYKVKQLLSTQRR